MELISKPVKLGVSVAASWAWGTSLIVGMEIAQQKGLTTWFIWAIANTLTLAFFGELARSGFLGRRIFDIKFVKVLALFIQAFCLIIQMNIIYKVLMQLGMEHWPSYGVASAVGVIFTLWMYKRGLATSILTDRWQWFIAMAAILVIIGIGMCCGVAHWQYPQSTSGDIWWGWWSAAILMSGPIGDVQHWQRAEVAGKSRAFCWGALFFGLYMLLILAMSYFKFNMAMNIILLLAVLCVTSSTIDSIAVAMHEISDKKVGTAVSIFICLFWGVFAHMGVLSLWSKAGVYRVAFALFILAMGAAAYFKHRAPDRVAPPNALNAVVD